MMVWRQHHINNTSPLSPSALQASVLQLSVPKLSEGKFKVLLAYNVHETLRIQSLFLLGGIFRVGGCLYEKQDCNKQPHLVPV